ncbi:hypothetical protein T11_8743 [Trichinella zimbabwensis]|uniref:Uncharacterized protein n=1 Tax=Trichinella zimbabwensis TaxID=268475 RepID=A0A0V1HHG5_9BILA|nr:hypothetical protein T11_8743 [Trichinella zimbabwensis]
MPIRTRGNGLHHDPSGDCSSSLDMVSQTVIDMSGIVKQSFSLTSFLSRSVYVSCFGELITRNLFKRSFLICQYLCYDGPFWDDARLHHGDVTGVLELECQRSTVGGSVVVRVARDFALLFANLSPERIKRFLKDQP